MSGTEPRKDRALVPPDGGNPRRRNMQANRRRDTNPELTLRSALHAAGYRYRVDFRIDLDGARVRPDIVFTRAKVAIFVDGCFWHSCPEHGREPRVNSAYWTPKLQKTRERDRRNTEALCSAGWLVVRIWAHVPTADAMSLVEQAIRGTRRSS
jgi:DNA mismatch endonuclease (patch repair protein)